MRKLLIAAVLAGLAGCASNYGPVTYKGGALGGYREVQLSADTYRVSYENSDLNFVRKANVDDMVLRRAADLALEKGFSCFIIQERDAITQLHKRKVGTITVKLQNDRGDGCNDAALVARQLAQ